MNDAQVLIAGGGPVGLICAYALGKRGIDVAVFDENPDFRTIHGPRPPIRRHLNC